MAANSIDRHSAAEYTKWYNGEPVLRHSYTVPEGMTRWVAGVEYDGSVFQGWQTQQPGVPTVQSAVEEALSRIANTAIAVVCAGRTDAGVSGVGQVVHFDSPVERSVDAWLRGGNTHLPPTINLTWVRPAPVNFHARFAAISRSYRYQILNRPVRSALQFRNYTHWRYPLDVERMHQAAQNLLGEHDFTSFRASSCQAKTAQRNISAISVLRQGDVVSIEVTANAFLHHMVRNIAGVLIEIGQGRQPVEWTKTLLDVCDRSAASITAPPQGLCFMRVGYPQVVDPLS